MCCSLRTVYKFCWIFKWLLQSHTSHKQYTPPTIHLSHIHLLNLSKHPKTSWIDDAVKRQNEQLIAYNMYFGLNEVHSWTANMHVRNEMTFAKMSESTENSLKSFFFLVAYLIRIWVWLDFDQNTTYIRIHAYYKQTYTCGRNRSSI